MAGVNKKARIAAHFVGESGEATRIAAVVAAAQVECGGDDLAVIEQFSARGFEPFAGVGDAGRLFVVDLNEDTTVETTGEVLVYAEHAGYRTLSRRLYIFGPASEASRRSAREMAARWVGDLMEQGVLADLRADLADEADRAERAIAELRSMRKPAPMPLGYEVYEFEVASP